MEGYVYFLQGLPGDLGSWTSALEEPRWHWVADGARLTMGQDAPPDWKDQGAIFGPKGELRWWRAEGKAYQALLLTDTPVPNLSPLPGKWTMKEGSLFLQNLEERRLCPNFSTYPHGETKGEISVKVYHRDGVATFVSMRAFARR
ncbi:MAG: hypothetical protein ACP5UM_09320 [Anaerolineae bacterium]